MSDTTPKRYRKKPVVIEAIRYDPPNNCAEVAAFLGVDDYVCPDYDDEGHGEEVWLIETLEGTMEASPGDFIIRGVQGEFYPCKPDIFAATYEKVVDSVDDQTQTEGD
jgi:hypothetical protein